MASTFSIFSNTLLEYINVTLCWAAWKLGNPEAKSFWTIFSLIFWGSSFLPIDLHRQGFSTSMLTFLQTFLVIWFKLNKVYYIVIIKVEIFQTIVQIILF